MTRVALQIEPQWGFSYEEVATIAAATEAADWDALWLSDHLLWSPDAVDRNCYEAWTLLAALAAATTTLRLGTLVTCNSYRHPSLLAKMAAGIDAMSGGRVDFGIGAGWKQEEYRAYGYDFPGVGVRQRQMSEAIDVTRLLWTEPYADYSGEHYRLERAVCAPKPVQSPMPIWVGGHGDNLLRIVAEKGDGWNMVFGRTLDQLRDRHAVLDRHCEEVGRDPASVRRSVFLFTALADTPAEIEALADDLGHRLGDGAERLLEAGKAAGVVGSADQIASALAHHLDVGFDGLHLLLPYGHEIDQIEGFTTDVLPTLGRG
ncbi:MAG: TIGR03560 family F420-dependent LLM class oxidoreductase [Acidimicrobiia bacterium]|nr:TIGR03560 family F420-dependent LLM class oxidoreductase [Acidimicrobiia bacterium]